MNRPLEPSVVRAAFRQVAEGLLRLHTAHIIHGDLKVDNVVLTVAGQAKLIDYGYMSALGGTGVDDAAAAAFRVCFADFYTSPEARALRCTYPDGMVPANSLQALAGGGRTVGDVLKALDVWMLGCVEIQPAEP